MAIVRCQVDKDFIISVSDHIPDKSRVSSVQNQTVLRHANQRDDVFITIEYDVQEHTWEDVVIRLTLLPEFIVKEGGAVIVALPVIDSDDLLTGEHVYHQVKNVDVISCDDWLPDVSMIFILLHLVNSIDVCIGGIVHSYLNHTWWGYQ